MPRKTTRKSAAHTGIRRRRRRSNGGLVRLAFLALVIVGAVILFTNYSQDLFAALSTGDQEVPLPIAEGDTWWNGSYPYRRQVDISTTRDSLVTLAIDHGGLVAARKSTADGHDLKLIAQIDDAFAEISQSNQYLNTASTSITFDTSRYPDAHYYLYYGNLAATPSQVLGAVVITRTGSQVGLNPEQMPSCGILPARTWHLVEDAKTSVPLEVISGVDATKTKLLYTLIDGEQELKLGDFRVADLSQDSTGNPVIQLSNVQPGDLEIALIAETEGNQVRCNNLAIRASAPIYVAWTIDWEGYDVQQWVLDSVQELASKYSIPMTQFFNPRIYVAGEIPEARRQALTSWVLARASAFGDEIALHMHMQYDMVSAAGVEPKHAPNWGTGRDGYDVLTSSYNYAEMTKILTWGMQQFAAHGLTKPTGFRAGGWFAGADTLKALNDYGFDYDSSGREAYSFGAQSKQGIWNLQFTTMPYQPSQTDPNLGGEQHLQMWEVPNNGGDSYWFSYEDMMGRLYANYQPGTIADEPKLVTYLTHFDWYDVDKPKLESLFAELNRNSYQEDNGPIIFTTVSEALNTWR
jgi:hypothetical protein